ncbi:MAG: hypothetical protein ACXVYY_18190 [Oryzihumus sp.]
MYANTRTAQWRGVSSSGPHAFEELQDWWRGRPSLGEDPTWSAADGPYLLLCVDFLGLSAVYQEGGVIAGQQVLAQLYEKLAASAGPARIHLANSEYALVWRSRDAAFADATVAALEADPIWRDQVRGDLVEAPTGPGLVNRLRHAGEPPRAGIRDLRTVPLLAQHAGLVSDEPDVPWREEPWWRPVPAGETRQALCPRNPPPPVPAHLRDTPPKRPNAELRELIHRNTRDDGPYTALFLGATPRQWGQMYDERHPHGSLPVRLAQVLQSCIGPGRYYHVEYCTVVLWHASESRHAEHAVATMNADPVLSPFAGGFLVQEHGPRLGQALRKVAGIALDWPRAPIVDLRGATPLSRAERRSGLGRRMDWGLG